jgi:hypothetical protein
MISKILKWTGIGICALMAGALMTVMPALSQQTPPAAQSVYPWRYDSTIATFAAQVAGTVNSADQFLYGNGVICKYNQTARSGTSSTTFAIQAKDAASGTYTSYLTSGAVTTNAESTLVIAPGIQTSSLPSNVAALNFVLPRVWRVQTVIGGTGGPAVTGTIGCSVVN